MRKLSKFHQTTKSKTIIIELDVVSRIKWSKVKYKRTTLIHFFHVEEETMRSLLTSKTFFWRLANRKPLRFFDFQGLYRVQLYSHIQAGIPSCITHGIPHGVPWQFKFNFFSSSIGAWKHLGVFLSRRKSNSWGGWLKPITEYRKWRERSPKVVIRNILGSVNPGQPEEKSRFVLSCLSCRRRRWEG